MLTQLTPEGTARLSVFVNPLVLWLWIAGAIIVIGGLIAAWPAVGAARAGRQPGAGRGAGRGAGLSLRRRCSRAR